MARPVVVLYPPFSWLEHSWQLLNAKARIREVQLDHVTLSGRGRGVTSSRALRKGQASMAGKRKVYVVGVGMTKVNCNSYTRVHARLILFILINFNLCFIV